MCLSQGFVDLRSIQDWPPLRVGSQKSGSSLSPFNNLHSKNPLLILSKSISCAFCARHEAAEVSPQLMYSTEVVQDLVNGSAGVWEQCGADPRFSPAGFQQQVPPGQHGLL